jgi:hypothetical protein
MSTIGSVHEVKLFRAAEVNPIWSPDNLSEATALVSKLWPISLSYKAKIMIGYFDGMNTLWIFDRKEPVKQPPRWISSSDSPWTLWADFLAYLRHMDSIGWRAGDKRPEFAWMDCPEYYDILSKLIGAKSACVDTESSKTMGKCMSAIRRDTVLR